MRADADSLPTRPVGIWSLEKLAIVMLYMRAFTTACKSAGGGFYVDGFAGPGLCSVRRAQQEPRFVWGSPLLALHTSPRFERCIFVESDAELAHTLAARAGAFRSRANVRQGDANVELPNIMRDSVPSRAPCFCLLDPEGTELEWKTLVAIAGTPDRRRKAEMLVLFPSSSHLRLLPLRRAPDAANVERLDRFFPDDSWRSTYDRRCRRLITPDQAVIEYAKLYARGLRRDLAYKHVEPHPIKAPRSDQPGSRRRELYRLIFATDHDAGHDVMSDVFKRGYALDYPVTSMRPLL